MSSPVWGVEVVMRCSKGVHNSRSAWFHLFSGFLFECIFIYLSPYSLIYFALDRERKCQLFVHIPCIFQDDFMTYIFQEFSKCLATLEEYSKSWIFVLRIDI